MKTSTPAKQTTKTRQGFFNNEHPFMVSRANPAGFSLSEMSGHISFICVCAAYLNKDILMLRILSMASISLSIVFQYYRAIPLWIPIRWNTLLLGINTVMTASLILERTRADNMPADMENIYLEGHFEKRGFSKVEFLRLFEKATKVHVTKGAMLARDGQENKTLFFVVQGNINIQRKGQHIAEVTANHFIGEMTFLNYLLADESDENIKSSSSSKPSGTIATADATVVTDELVAYAWSFDSLTEYLSGEREVRNALSAYMNHDLRAKLAALSEATTNSS